MDALDMPLSKGKTEAFCLVPIKSYSKSNHPPSFLEYAVEIQ
jgi:hypothetical protein